jgi:hypothetical protein
VHEDSAVGETSPRMTQHCAANGAHIKTEPEDVVGRETVGGKMAFSILVL